MYRQQGSYLLPYFFILISNVNISEYFDITFSIILIVMVALNIQVYKFQHEENKRIKEENNYLKMKLLRCGDDKRA